MSAPSNLPAHRDDQPQQARIIRFPQPASATNAAETARALRIAANVLLAEADHHERLAALTQACPTGCGANMAGWTGRQRAGHMASHGWGAQLGAWLRGWRG